MEHCKDKQNQVHIHQSNRRKGQVSHFPSTTGVTLSHSHERSPHVGYISPRFSPRYTRVYIGATNTGPIRSGYHFALSDISSWATEAKLFLTHGSGRLADGITLPGTLDIEYNPYGVTCYGLSKSGVVTWTKNFSDTYQGCTGRYPVIYTTNDW